MDCRTDCPYLIESAETRRSLCTSRDEMLAQQIQLDENATQNEATAQLLMTLPYDNPDRASATAALQDAVVGVGDAKSQVEESVNLFNAAIEASYDADQAVRLACSGAPIAMADTAHPGYMVLACAGLL
jgi:hypothetical protein